MISSGKCEYMQSTQQVNFSDGIKSEIQSLVVAISFCFFFTLQGLSQNYWKDLVTPSLGGGASGQIGVEGATLLHLNAPRSSYGIALKYGLAVDHTRFFNRSVKSIFHVRAGYYFPQTQSSAGNIMAFTNNAALPSSIAVPYRFEQQASYFTFDARQDYYFFTSQKEQMALYCGWIFGFNWPTYIGEYMISTFDSINYTIDAQSNAMRNFRDGKVNFILGLNFGYDLYVGAFGAIYLETSCLFNVQSAKYLPTEFTMNSRFFAGINLGYRFEFY